MKLLILFFKSKLYARINIFKLFTSSGILYNFIHLLQQTGSIVTNSYCIFTITDWDA